MRLHYLFYVCVASYSGGDFFLAMNRDFDSKYLSSIQCSMNSLATDNLSSHTFSNVIPTALETSLDEITAWSSTPLPQAHAHNDYEHERPLLDALAHGFTYIEADVHLKDGELYVAHDIPLVLSPKRTLRTLYLDPLDAIVQRNGGQVYPGKNALPIYLMIDIKTEAAATYEALKIYLEPYRHLLTSFENSKKTERAITVFLSGNRPVRQVLEEKNTLMCIDGRLEDLGKGIPADLMPVVSERFSNIFGWEILGQQRTENQWLVLQHLARIAHSEGKKLRLWASPESEQVWEEMLNAGCDIINTDELELVRRFFQRRSIASLANH